jgi:hypothetical protein
MASAPQPDHLRKSFHPRGREVLTEHALEVSYFFDVLGDPFYQEALINQCSKIEFSGRLATVAEACLLEQPDANAHLVCAAVLREAYASFTPAGNTAVANVHHHWVTYAGDTINLADATANAYQVGSYDGIYAVGGGSYTANITGGTGRFASATGQLSFSGVLDQNQGTVVLRYLGPICFARP